MHEHTSSPGHAGWPATLASSGPILALLVLAVGYLALTRRARRGPQRWSRWRSLSFVTGLLLVALALLPGPYPEHDFRAHMLQHLLIGMYAPIALVLGAPMTLLLRTLPHRGARLLGRVLSSRPLGTIAHPVTAAVLNLGGLLALYLTPLYAATVQHAWLHHIVHLHFLLAGYLFAYSIAGPDPAPHRPGVPARLVVLAVAITVHAVLAQVLYAGVLPHVRVPAEQRKAGADLMYYAGDIGELVLAFALVSTWRPTAAANGRRPRRRPLGSGASTPLSVNRFTGYARRTR